MIGSWAEKYLKNRPKRKAYWNKTENLFWVEIWFCPYHGALMRYYLAFAPNYTVAHQIFDTWAKRLAGKWEGGRIMEQT